MTGNPLALDAGGAGWVSTLSTSRACTVFGLFGLVPRAMRRQGVPSVPEHLAFLGHESPWPGGRQGVPTVPVHPAFLGHGFWRMGPARACTVSSLSSARSSLARV